MVGPTSDEKPSVGAGELAVLAAVARLPDPIVIYLPLRDDSAKIVDFEIAYANDAACTASELTREEQVGGRLLELLPGRLESELFDDYCRVAESGVPLQRVAVSHQELLGEQTIVSAFDVRVVPVGEAVAVNWRDITDRVKTEEALRESESHLKLAVDAVPVTLLMQDKDLKFSWVTDPQLGFRLEDVVGKTDFDFLTPEEAERSSRIKRRVMETGETTHFRLSMTHGGRRLWYDNRCAPLRDEAGDVIGVISATFDVTDYVQAGERQAWSQAVADAASAAIFGIDTDWMITSWNRGAESLFGYAADQAIGRPVTLLAAGTEPGAFTDAVETALGGEPQLLPLIDELADADGERQTLVVSLAPIVTDGPVDGLACVAHPAG